MIKQVPKVLLAGDSISFGYGSLVQAILRNKFEVSNLPENGGTSANLLAHIDDWMVKPGYDIIHVNCGLHDIAIECETRRHRAPLEQYRMNVEEIIRRLKDETSAIIVWATTTPVIDERHTARKGFDRHEQDVSVYNEAARRIMLKLNVPINDLHRVIEDAKKEICIGPDGVHMTETGYALLAKAVTEFFSTLTASIKNRRGRGNPFEVRSIR